jgi:O-antigen/teichoic acid export membrane protein
MAGVLFLFVPASQAIPLPLGLFAAIGITVASLLLGIANATLLSERRPGVIFIGSLLAGITKCAALLLALSAAGVIGAYGVGAVVGMAVAPLIAYRNLPSGRENASEQPSMRRYAFANWISNIGSLLPPAIVPSLLLVRGGAELAAYGAMPLLLLSFLNLPASVVARSVFAEASRNPERLSALVRRGLLLAIAGSGLGFIGAALFGEVVLSLFGRGYAQEGAPLLMLLAAASFVAVPNYFIDTVLNVRRDAIGYAFVNIAGSIAVAGAVLLLAQDLPSLGIAWMFGQATYLTIGLLVLVSRRRVRHG